MGRQSRMPRTDLAFCTLTLTRPQMDAIDQAVRFLGIDRQAVLLRGFDVLTLAVGIVLRHEGEEPRLEPQSVTG